MKYTDYDFEADITAIKNSNNKYQAIINVNYTLSNKLQLGENKLLDMQWDSEDEVNNARRNGVEIPSAIYTAIKHYKVKV